MLCAWTERDKRFRFCRQVSTPFAGFPVIGRDYGILNPMGMIAIKSSLS